MVGTMQGSIDGIEKSLTEIKKAITDLRVDISSNYVTNSQLQVELRGMRESRALELQNIRDNFEPTKKTVENVVNQVLKYVVGAGLGFLVAKEFVS
jgi:hypothetical protein